MISYLITSDLHWVDQPQFEYRFNIVDFLMAQIVKEPTDGVLILGDLTDRKDNHSSRLVNRCISELHKITSIGKDVVILRGNHDAIDEAIPYFDFLNYMTGITYLKNTREFLGDESGASTLWLPNSRNPIGEWGETVWSSLGSYDLVLMHQTVSGSLSESGVSLSSNLPLEVLGAAKKIISGDVHVPQRIGNVEYVGSPYHVHFGDKFEPRVMRAYINSHKVTVKSIPTGFPRLHSISLNIDTPITLEGLGIDKGDRLKIRVGVPAHKMDMFSTFCEAVRRSCDELGCTVDSFSPVLEDLGTSALTGEYKPLPRERLSIIKQFLPYKLGKDDKVRAKRYLEYAKRIFSESDNL